MKRIYLLFLSFLPGFASFGATAQQANLEYSADIDTTLPQQGTQSVRMYFGKNQIRSDFDMDGKQVVQIVDMNSQQAYMINPQEQTYLRRTAGPGEAAQVAPGEGKTGDNPCAGMQNINCKQLGVDDVNGRQAAKWEFENTAQEQSGKMLIWLDQERGMPVRQFMPDGSTMEMKMLGHEEVAGRKTEKWEMTAKRPGGKSQVSYQWYDPQLKVNIREEQEGGFIREFRNIRIGPQAAELFSIPAGYREVSMPTGDLSPGGQGQAE